MLTFNLSLLSTSESKRKADKATFYIKNSKALDFYPSVNNKWAPFVRDTLVSSMKQHPWCNLKTWTYKCSSLGRSVKAPFSMTLRLLMFRTELQKQKESCGWRSAVITTLLSTATHVRVGHTRALLDVKH